MITIKEIHTHYITGKLRILKGYTVYYRLDKKRTRLDGSIFIETEKTVISLSEIIDEIKIEINSQ